jgi:hypothetical protein
MEYYISFDTKINPGKLEAVKITIENVTITDMDKPLKIDLVNHPLYSDLRNYVLANEDK